MDGQATLNVHLSVTVPHATLAQVTAASGETQPHAFAFFFALSPHVSGAVQVSGHITGSPQLFVVPPHSRPLQLASSASGTQHFVGESPGVQPQRFACFDALSPHVSGAVQVSGHITGSPQLFVRGPHATPLHVASADSGRHASTNSNRSSFET